MSFAFTPISATAVRLAAAALCWWASGAGAAPVSLEKPFANAAAATLVNASPCRSKDACIDSIMAAASAGRHVEQLQLMATMRSIGVDKVVTVKKSGTRPHRGSEARAVGNIDANLTMILREAKNEFAAMPEYRRALALAYLKADQAQEAERELREAIATAPTQASFWVDLAMAFSLQGKNDNAVSALVVADAWAQDPKALRAAYAQAARAPSIKQMGQVYRDALAVIAQNASVLERFDAELPAIPPGMATLSKDRENTFGRVLFDRCSKPEWPRSSLRYEETGTVTLAFFVDADGDLLRAKKLQSSGYAELDNAAIVALAACTLQAAVSNGKPTPSWIKIQYVWTIE